MSDLGFNKIAGAVLATGLGIVGLNQLSSRIYEPEMAKKPGFAVAVVESGGADANLPDLPPDWGTVLKVADVSAGQAIFAKCGSCHKPTDENGTGPGLNGVLGRKPAGHPGFAYSSSMTAFGAKQPIWDYQHVYEFIKAPGKYVDGTKMTFAGLKKADDRINVIAYLHTLGSTLPVPAPDPAAAGKPTTTNSVAQAGQPEQAPKSGPAQAPTVQTSQPTK